MARHEEKYILDYRQYALLRQRCSEALTADGNAPGGSYVITSLYYDDPKMNGLYEKLDGLADHRKFRVRSYDGGDAVIKLERKDKHGILTEKLSATVTPEQLRLLDGASTDTDAFSGPAQEMALQMKTAAMVRVCAVRYRRDAFVLPGTDIRITFDRDLEAIAPEEQALFDLTFGGIPALPPGQVILEIKYGKFLPGWLRKLLNVSAKQLSVSKYALCCEAMPALSDR